MRLTSKGRYAVMALVDLARFDNITPVSLRDISLRQGISLDFLEQIFSKLRKKEIVQSVRGTQGGYILNKKAKEIKLTNIFDAVDEKVKTVQCKKDSKKGCNGKATKCITHNLWDELENHINNFFNELNIKNLEPYFDAPTTLAKKLSLRGVPTSVLFNGDGKEFARIIGSIDFDDLKFIEWLKNYN